MEKNPTGSSYLHQTAVLKELAKPSSERAVLSTEVPDAAYAEGRANAGAEEARLAEKQREFLSALLSAHDQLSEFSKNNDLANLIGIGNIAAQGVSGYQQTKKLDEQSQMLRDIANTYAEMPGLQREANAANEKLFRNETFNLRNVQPVAPDDPRMKFAPVKLPAEFQQTTPPAPPAVVSSMTGKDLLKPEADNPPSLARISSMTGKDLFAVQPPKAR